MEAELRDKVVQYDLHHDGSGRGFVIYTTGHY